LSSWAEDVFLRPARVRMAGLTAGRWPMWFEIALCEVMGLLAEANAHSCAAASWLAQTGSIEADLQAK